MIGFRSEKITPCILDGKSSQKKSPYNKRTMESAFWPFRPFCPFAESITCVFSASCLRDSVPGHHQNPSEINKLLTGLRLCTSYVPPNGRTALQNALLPRADLREFRSASTLCANSGMVRGIGPCFTSILDTSAPAITQVMFTGDVVTVLNPASASLRMEVP